MSISNNQTFATELQQQMFLREYEYQLKYYGEDFIELDHSENKISESTGFNSLSNSPYKMVNNIANNRFSETHEEISPRNLFKDFQRASEKLEKRLFQETSTEETPYKKRKLNFTHLEDSYAEGEYYTEESCSEETLGFNGMIIPATTLPIDPLNLNPKLIDNNLYENSLRQISLLELNQFSTFPTDSDICKRLLNYFSGGDRYNDFEVYYIIQDWIESVNVEDKENSILLRTSKNPKCVIVCYYTEFALMQKTITKSANGWIAYGKDGIMKAESLFEFCKLLVPNFKIENFLLSGQKEHRSAFYQ